MSKVDDAIAELQNLRALIRDNFENSMALIADQAARIAAQDAALAEARTMAEFYGGGFGSFTVHHEDGTETRDEWASGELLADQGARARAWLAKYGGRNG